MGVFTPGLMNSRLKAHCPCPSPLVAGFFEPSIQAIITAVTEQKRLSPKQVSVSSLSGHRKLSTSFSERLDCILSRRFCSK